MVSGSVPSLPDITIVGGGIIGVALARELAVRGQRVQLLERNILAQEASLASAGIISPPASRYGLRADLALASYRRYPALIAEVVDETGISVGWNQTGELELGADESRDALQATWEWQHAQGMRVEWLDRPALEDREPALHPSLTSGIYSPDSGSLILSRLTIALARSAANRGATIREHTHVGGVAIGSGRATAIRTLDGEEPVGALIIAAGAWSRALSETLDFEIPTIPVRGQMLAVADPPVPIRSVIAAGGGYLVPRADGTVAVGATEEAGSGFDSRVTPDGIRWLAELIDRTAPSLAHGRLIDTWAGLRPGTTHGEPVIGRIPHLDNVWIATGHFRSGALLAPATAEALASLVLDGTVDPMIAPFDPATVGNNLGR